MIPRRLTRPFATGLHDFAALVQMFWTILDDMRYFTFMLFVITISFACAIVTLDIYSDYQVERAGWSGLPVSLGRLGGRGRVWRRAV